MYVTVPDTHDGRPLSATATCSISRDLNQPCRYQRDITYTVSYPRLALYISALETVG